MVKGIVTISNNAGIIQAVVGIIYHQYELTSFSCISNLLIAASQPSTSFLALFRASCLRSRKAFAESLLRMRRRSEASLGRATPLYFATALLLLRDFDLRVEGFMIVSTVASN